MLETLDMWQLLEKSRREYPEKVAVIFNEQKLTYAELLEQANRLAAGLYRRGLRKGDHLALVMPNWPEFIIAFFAAARLGAVIVPFNTRYREHELAYMLQNSDAKFVVTCASFDGFDYLPLLESLRPGLPGLELVIASGLPGSSGSAVAWQDLISEGKNQQLPDVPINPREDLLILLYTSGTTGLSKAAMLTHYNIIWNSLALAERLECTSADVILATVPLFHIFGISCCVVEAVGSNATLVLMETYKPETALKLIEQERVTVHHGVPTMFILELNHPHFTKYNLASLRTGIIAAAPAPAEIIRRIRRDMGCEIVSSYGLSETAPALSIASFDDTDEVRAETVGKAIPGVEIKIVDDAGSELPPGETGELVCRTPGLMKGYYRNPEATAQAIDEYGWFKSGDLATRDAAGNIRIVGRKKEMINRGGFKIYPREIEEFYYKHPKVLEIAIIGLPDPLLGEKTCACIKLKQDQSAGVDEMRAWVRDKVADFKVPDMVCFVESFPMTASGKIMKRSLIEQMTNH